MRLVNDLYTVEKAERCDNAMSVDIALNPGADIYKGHFPGNPITPGVVMIRIAGELLSEFLQRPVNLASVANIKYLSVISPLEHSRVTYRIDKISVTDGAKCSVQVSVIDGDTMFAKMSLKYTIG